MELNAKIYIAGHCGLFGSAPIRNLRDNGRTNIVMHTHAGLDLIHQAEVENIRVGQDLIIPVQTVIGEASLSMPHHVLIQLGNLARKLSDLGRQQAQRWFLGVHFRVVIFLTHHKARVLAVYSVHI